INGPEGKVSSVSLENVKTGEKYDFPTDGVFVYIGMVPLSEPFKSLNIINEEGYVPTNENMETSVPGVFAAGDIREKELRQIRSEERRVGKECRARRAREHYKRLK